MVIRRLTRRYVTTALKMLFAASLINRVLKWKSYYGAIMILPKMFKKRFYSNSRNYGSLNHTTLTGKCLVSVTHFPHSVYFFVKPDFFLYFIVLGEG